MNFSRVYPYVDHANPEPQMATWGVSIQKDHREGAAPWPDLGDLLALIDETSGVTFYSEVEVRGGSFVFQRMETLEEAAERTAHRDAWAAESEDLAYKQYLRLKERFEPSEPA